MSNLYFGVEKPIVITVNRQDLPIKSMLKRYFFLITLIQLLPSV